MQVHRPQWFHSRVACLCGALIAFGVSATAEEIVRLERLPDRSLEAQAFRLERPMTLRLQCEGAGEGDEESMYAYGWILNARTRQVEWALRVSNSTPGRGNNLVFEDDVELPAGEFIAYYTAYWSGHYKTIEILGKRIARIWVDTSRRKRPKEIRRWRLQIDTLREEDADDVVELHRIPAIADEKAFVKFTRMGDDDFDSAGFTLPKRMQIAVYCQGEFISRDDGAVDLGWIVNAETRERVWELGPDNFRHGGGTYKNKMSREIITLPAGHYVASYATDGSHSAEGWNAPPPYDPEAWGMILSAVRAGERDVITRYQGEADAKHGIVSLIRQRDGAYASKGFTLKEPLDVRVYAIGEYDNSNHEFADHGWIEEFGSARSIWRMNRRNTRHAGGASKNLAADEVFKLEPGDYVVYYVTDGSHSYEKWNARPPHDPTHWGIALYATRAYEPSAVEYFDAEARVEAKQDYLARLVRIGNDQHVRQSFRLEKPTRVRILALGEGLFREMADYGWIVDDSGNWVWEMTWRNTTHAGGARKNRQFDGVIMLDRGEYEVHYVTDGSHAWGEWNQPRPREPRNWGITVFSLENQSSRKTP